MTRLEKLKESPSQTAGPYVHIGCTPNFCGIEGVFSEDLGAQMVTAGTRGERISVTGVIYDGAGAPLRDAMVEIWQADADGRMPGGRDPRGGGDPAFSGFGRQPADGTTGEWRFETIKPGSVPFKTGAPMAPHLTFWIVARGVNLGLHTRMYFPEETSANAADPVLARIEHRERVETLIATVDGPGRYRFEIHLQGPRETVFFDI
ncbi:MAG: protocatechuate 3,4-dioxygenase subunit alpha [Pseudomonadota bacterium]